MPSQAPSLMPTDSPTSTTQAPSNSAPSQAPVSSIPTQNPTATEFEIGSEQLDLSISELDVIGDKWVLVPATGDVPEHVVVPNGGPNPNCKHHINCEDRIVVPL